MNTPTPRSDIQRRIRMAYSILVAIILTPMPSGIMAHQQDWCGSLKNCQGWASTRSGPLSILNQALARIMSYFPVLKKRQPSSGSPSFIIRRIMTSLQTSRRVGLSVRPAMNQEIGLPELLPLMPPRSWITSIANHGSGTSLCWMLAMVLNLRLMPL